MAANEKSLSRFEIVAIISLCGLLFIVACKDLDHLLWAIPAMSLFFVAGLILSGLLFKPEIAPALVAP